MNYRFALTRLKTVVTLRHLKVSFLFFLSCLILSAEDRWLLSNARKRTTPLRLSTGDRSVVIDGWDDSSGNDGGVDDEGDGDDGVNGDRGDGGTDAGNGDNDNDVVDVDDCSKTVDAAEDDIVTEDSSTLVEAVRNDINDCSALVDAVRNETDTVSSFADDVANVAKGTKGKDEQDGGILSNSDDNRGAIDVARGATEDITAGT